MSGRKALCLPPFLTLLGAGGNFIVLKRVKGYGKSIVYIEYSKCAVTQYTASTVLGIWNGIVNAKIDQKYAKGGGAGRAVGAGKNVQSHGLPHENSIPDAGKIVRAQEFCRFRRIHFNVTRVLEFNLTVSTLVAECGSGLMLTGSGFDHQETHNSHTNGHYRTQQNEMYLQLNKDVKCYTFSQLI